MLIRIVGGESVVYNVDMSADTAYSSGNPGRRAFVDLGGARTGIMVALRKDDQLLGAINAAFAAAPICSQQRAPRRWLIGPPEDRTIVESR